MTPIGSKIPDVFNLLWDFFIKEFKKNDANWNDKLVKHQIKFDFLNDLMSDKMLSKYQWEYESNGLHNLLEHYYLPSFLLKIWHHAQKLKVNEKPIEESELLLDFFKEKFSILENEILLSDNLEYYLYIPTFRIHFPESSREIVFDSNHKIIDLSDKESPYGKREFKEIPKSWRRSWDEGPNASFEVKFYIKKRSASEDPYDAKWHPIMPRDSYTNYNIFIEKFRSIFEFFLCYGQKHDLGYLTFSDKFYIKSPPFSSILGEYQIDFAKTEFPTAYYPTYFNNPKMNWIQMWEDNYDWFYSTFYEKDPITTNNMIFRYAFEVLRTMDQIPIKRVRNFLLISIFEGLLLSDNKKDKKKIRKLSKAPKNTGNKGPAAKVFVKISEIEKEYWQFIFQTKYPLRTPLTKFETEKDLYKFIISAFDYRNNIAHADIGKKLKLKPTYLKPTNSDAPDEFLIESLISEYFPLFVIFIIRIWLKYAKTNAKTNSQEWIQYIISIL